MVSLPCDGSCLFRQHLLTATSSWVCELVCKKRLINFFRFRGLRSKIIETFQYFGSEDCRKSDKLDDLTSYAKRFGLLIWGMRLKITVELDRLTSHRERILYLTRLYIRIVYSLKISVIVAVSFLFFNKKFRRQKKSLLWFFYNFQKW